MAKPENTARCLWARNDGRSNHGWQDLQAEYQKRLQGDSEDRRGTPRSESHAGDLVQEGHASNTSDEPEALLPRSLSRAGRNHQGGRSDIEACIAKGCCYKGNQRVAGIAGRKGRGSWKGMAVEQVKTNAYVDESLCDFLTRNVALHTLPRKCRSARFLPIL